MAKRQNQAEEQQPPVEQQPVLNDEPQASFVSHSEDPMLTYTEAGELIGKSRTTLRRWVEEGLLRSFRDPNGLSRIRKSELTRFYSGTAMAIKEAVNTDG